MKMSNRVLKVLKINETKTQILSVSSASYNTRATFNTDSAEIGSEQQLKMLGFIFSNKPTVQAQLDYLIRKANKIYFVLLHYKRAGVNKERLKDIYLSLIHI